MKLESVRLRLETPAGAQQVRLSDGLDADLEEQAANEEIQWIKALRHASDGTVTLRDALRFRGDSMWWFIEIYLHKRGRVRQLLRAVHAMEALIARHRPSAIEWESGDAWAAPPVVAVASRAGVAIHRAPTPPVLGERLRTWLDFLRWTTFALLGRLKPRSAARAPRAGALPSGATSRDITRDTTYDASCDTTGDTSRDTTRGPLVGYVHSAFWQAAKAEEEDGGREGYVGPVLDSLEASGHAHVVLVGLGPQENFRARRWWHPVVSAAGPTNRGMVTPIEALAPIGALRPSLAFGLRCPRLARWLCADRMRDAARINGLDLWLVIREELRGAALLQLPWSARAMDEAAASLDALRPSVVFTYAEAGGWGRALALEARRRGIACVGLQHGFIYRHWLHYVHEPDEMAPSPGNASDRGFPRPTVTLVYDDFAARHLRTTGAFPPDAVRVTGSPSLDRLVAGSAAVTADRRQDCRTRLGAGAAQILLVISKFTQIGRELPSLLDAAAQVPGAFTVLVPHPSETAAPYEQLAAGRARVAVAPMGLSLPELLSIASLVVTVHSTVGLDALSLGVPCLVLGLPTNLSPFVEAGVMTGVRSGAATPEIIERLLTETTREGPWRQRARDFLDLYAIRPDGHAADRAATALLELGSPRK